MPVAAGPAALVTAAAASDRLSLSRERLREALRAAASSTSPDPSMDARTDGGGFLARLRHRWDSWRPLGLTGLAVARVANAVVRPMVARHPVRMAVGAALFGGLLAWSRPWRWILGSSLLAGLVPRLFARPAPGAPGSALIALLASWVMARSRRHNLSTESGSVARPRIRQGSSR